MKKNIWSSWHILFIFLLLISTFAIAAMLSGCGNPTGGGASGGGATAAQAHIVFTNPFNTETGVYINGKIVVNFATDMDSNSLTIEGFSLMEGTTSVPGTAEYNSYLKCLIFTPNPGGGMLDYNALYTATISSDAKTEAGKPLGLSYIWSFTTGIQQNTSAPTFLACDPSDNEINVSTNKTLTLVFSEPIDPDSLSSDNLYLIKINPNGSITTVEGASYYHSTNVIFVPKTSLTPNTTYEGFIRGGGGGVKNLADINLVSSKFISFETVDTKLKQQSVSLCTALTYGVLAGSFIHNTGSSVITGDAGTSPGTDFSGFTTIVPTGDGVVNGSMNVATDSSGAAAIDSELAYQNIVGRKGATSLPTIISNNTLKHGGLYNAPGNVELSGLVTLDGAGQSDAVFIFRVGGSLTVDPGCQINLINGADADDTTWLVNVNTIIGANAVFKGTVIGGYTITALHGSSIVGRLLCHGSVTLDDSFISIP